VPLARHRGPPSLAEAIPQGGPLQWGRLVLETDFETAEGAVTLIDFMPLRGQASDIVRLVVGRRGRVAMRTELVMRLEYGSVVPWVRRAEDGSLRAVAGPDMLALWTTAPVHGEDMRTVGDFVVAEGARVPFTLARSPSHLPPPPPIDPEAALADTEAFGAPGRAAASRRANGPGPCGARS
jgi:hypothetical protein